MVAFCLQSCCFLFLVAATVTERATAGYLGDTTRYSRNRPSLGVSAVLFAIISKAHGQHRKWLLISEAGVFISPIALCFLHMKRPAQINHLKGAICSLPSMTILPCDVFWSAASYISAMSACSLFSACMRACVRRCQIHTVCAQGQGRECAARGRAHYKSRS